MTTETKLITAEELANMPDDGRVLELDEGRLIEMPPPKFKHNRIMGWLSTRLTVHVEERGLGVVLPGDTGILIGRAPDTVRGPDICFFAAHRVPPEEAWNTYIDVVPDLIVEIVSPSATAAAVRRKTEQWLRAGAKLVWTIYPDTRSVVVSRSLNADQILYEGDTLTGEPVLPEFSVPVSAIFA